MATGILRSTKAFWTMLWSLDPMPIDIETGSMPEIDHPRAAETSETPKPPAPSRGHVSPEARKPDRVPLHPPSASVARRACPASHQPTRGPRAPGRSTRNAVPLAAAE